MYFRRGRQLNDFYVEIRQLFSQWCVKKAEEANQENIKME